MVVAGAIGSVGGFRDPKLGTSRVRLRPWRASPLMKRVRVTNPEAVGGPAHLGAAADGVGSPALGTRSLANASRCAGVRIRYISSRISVRRTFRRARTSSTRALKRSTAPSSSSPRSKSRCSWESSRSSSRRRANRSGNPLSKVRCRACTCRFVSASSCWTAELSHHRLRVWSPPWTGAGRAMSISTQAPRTSPARMLATRLFHPMWRRAAIL
jgi:hypothetical protein